LQIHNTMVLQRVELEEKVSSVHFWIYPRDAQRGGS